MSKLSDWGSTIWRAVRSKVVLTAIAGVLVQIAVRKQWIPDSISSQVVDGALFILCAIFRVTATVDLKQPATVLAPEQVPASQPDLVNLGH